VNISHSTLRIEKFDNNNKAVNTEREVTANRPDIRIKNKKEKTCILIDVAIPAGGNVVQKKRKRS